MAPRNNVSTANRSIWLGIPYPKHDVNTSVSLAASQVLESEQENEESKIYLNVHIIYIILLTCRIFRFEMILSTPYNWLRLRREASESSCL